MNNNNYRQSLLSIIILFLGFLLIRYALFDFHKMKDWPTVLFACCFVVIAICFFTKKTITPLITSISYTISFLLGYLFQTNGFDAGGGASNNLWLIWTIAIIVFLFLSIIIEFFVSKKLKR